MQVEFLQAYRFTIKHKVGVQNVVVDILSKKHAMFTSLQVSIVGFKVICMLMMLILVRFENQFDKAFPSLFDCGWLPV